MNQRRRILLWANILEPVEEAKKNQMIRKQMCDTERLQPSDIPKLDATVGNQLLSRDILKPLLEIVYQYKDSMSYNYVPGTDEDDDAGWEFYEKKFQEIYAALNANVYISHKIYLKIKQIIEEMQAFVKSFSGADGLPDRYFSINPNLRFYRCSFDMLEESGEAFLQAVSNGMLTYRPYEEDFRERDAYYEGYEEKSRDRNFQYDKEDFFMMELAFTLRLVFIKTLEETQDTLSL